MDPCEGVERHGVSRGLRDVAENQLRTALFEERADALAQNRQIGTADRAADCERDRLRRWGCHQEIDPPAGRNSSLADR
jgi:hypothetical protein